MLSDLQLVNDLNVRLEVMANKEHVRSTICSKLLDVCMCAWLENPFTNLVTIVIAMCAISHSYNWMRFSGIYTTRINIHEPECACMYIYVCVCTPLLCI